MIIHHFPTQFTPEIKVVFIKELCGTEEEVIGNAGLLGILSLLNKLLVNKLGQSFEKEVASKLATADRDRILAAIYTSIYGDKIESTLNCNNCQSLFDLNFSLKVLVNHLDSQIDFEGIQQLNKGIYQLSKEIQFRLPTGEDEQELIGLDPKEAEKVLLKNCMLKGNEQADLVKIQQAMQQLAPMVSTKMAAVCVECNHQQAVHFDIQTYLMTALQKEQSSLAKEVHRIAKAYGWSLKEILSLTRKQRRNYYALINSELNLS